MADQDRDIYGRIEQLTDIARGFQGGVVLAAAARLELFTLLDKGALGEKQVAEKLGLDKRATGIFLHALAGMSLLHKEESGRFSNSEIASELQCMQRLGTGGCTSQVITDTVLFELEATRAGGATNIAEGIKRGMEVLSTSGGHYGRPGAAPVIILMTDEEPNTHSGCDPACDDEDLWPAGDENYDCVVYYTQQARDSGILQLRPVRGT